MQILLDFSAFVAVFQRFFGLMIQFGEGMFRIPDDLRDDFHHSFHSTTLVVEFGRASAFLVGYGQLLTLLSIRLAKAFVIQISLKMFFGETK
jgi:hypothetical protein